MHSVHIICTRVYKMCTRKQIYVITREKEKSFFNQLNLYNNNNNPKIKAAMLLKAKHIIITK